MSPEPFDSRAKAPPAKRWEKGYGNENEHQRETGDLTGRGGDQVNSLKADKCEVESSGNFGYIQLRQ